MYFLALNNYVNNKYVWGVSLGLQFPPKKRGMCMGRGFKK